MRSDLTRISTLALVVSTLSIAPQILHAQVSSNPAVPPVLLVACWVPASGTVYRIDPTGQTVGLPKACLSATHRSFEWNQQGPKGDAGPQGDPGAKGDTGPAGTASLPVLNSAFYDLSGPTVPASGFLALGTLGQGSLRLPSGAGARLMWYPRKQAFRAGGVTGTQWNESSMGQSSFAGGSDTRASGAGSTAFGDGSTASGVGSTAFGIGNVASGEGATAGGKGATASGDQATAFGLDVTASGLAAFAEGNEAYARGRFSVALGNTVTASGNGSVAIGTALSANRTGTMLLGDRQLTVTAPTADYQFTARFAGGYRFLTIADDPSKSCMISSDAQLACSGGVNLGLTRATSVVYPVSATHSRKEYQSCPAGTQVIGGGVSTSLNDKGFGDFKVRASYPDFVNNRWYAEVRNDDIGSGEMQIFVVCIRT